MKNRFDYLDVILISLILVSLTFGTYFYFDKETRNILSEVKIDNITCDNKSLINTSECLRDWVSTFYNYTLRDDTEKNLSDIQTNGGDCYDYSHNIYEPILINLGFNVKHIEIYPDDDSETGHGFTIVWDKDLNEYCKIDMLNVDCLEFK